MRNKDFKLVLDEIQERSLDSRETGYFGLSFDKIHSIEIKIDEFEFSEFVKYTIEASSDTFWTGLFILLHEKFAKFESLDLIRLFESIDPSFSKILFLVYLCKYLEIDLLDFIDKCNLVEEERQYIINFSKNNKTFFKRSLRDKEYLEEYLGVTIDELRTTGLKIMNQHKNE